MRKNNIEPRAYLYCGKIYQPNSWQQKYCDYSCKRNGTKAEQAKRDAVNYKKRKKEKLHDEKLRRKKYPGTMLELWKIANEASEHNTSYGKYVVSYDKKSSKEDKR